MKLKKYLNYKTLLLIIISLLIFLNTCNKRKKVYKIGILSGLKTLEISVNAFKKRMTDLGYTEGENVIYLTEITGFDNAVYEEKINNFIQEKVDIIYTAPTESAVIAKNLTKDTGIPVVFSTSFIENTGLINSVQYPGGNITGLRYPGPDIALKRLDVLLQITPGAKIIFIPYFKGLQIIPAQLEVLRTAIKPMNIKIIEAPVETTQQLKAGINKHSKSIDAILTIPGPLSVTKEYYDIIAEYANTNNIPFGGSLIDGSEHGSIFEISINPASSGEDAAIFVHKILTGSPAGSIPVGSEDSYFILDYKRSVELGIKIPDSIIRQADRIIR